MGERTETGIYVNKSLWSKFKNKVKSQGFSTCFILETLIRGYMALDSQKPAGVDSVEKIVVNQKIEYLVKSPRRIRGPVLEDNCWINGVWTYREPEKGELLSKLGHVSECVCLECSKGKSKAVRI